MSAARLGKAASPQPTIVTPLNPTWEQSISNLNCRPHPAFARESDDEASSDEGGEHLGWVGSGSETGTAARWEYWTTREKDKGHPGYVRIPGVMGEDCKLLRNERERERGNWMDDDQGGQELSGGALSHAHKPLTHTPIKRQPQPELTILTTRSPPITHPSTTPNSVPDPIVPTSPLALSPFLAAPAAHNAASSRSSPANASRPLSTPSLVGPPALPPSLRLPFLPISARLLPRPPQPTAIPLPNSLDGPSLAPLSRPAGAAPTKSDNARAQSEVVLVGDSSDSEPSTADSMPAVMQQMGRGPAKTPSLVSRGRATAKASLKRRQTTLAAPVDDTRPAKRGKAKPRKSTDEFLEALQKSYSAFNKHRRQHATIASTIDRLGELAPVLVPRPLFVGLRVVLVNHHSIGTSRLPNAFDVAHSNNMRLLLRNGATLVKPEEFRSQAYRADQGPLTTHVIPLEMEGAEKFNPTFDDVLALLGPKHDKVDLAKLGPEVKVVKFNWVTESLTYEHRLTEGRYAWPGDPRSPLGSPTKRAGPAAQESQPNEGDSDEHSTDDDGHDHTDGTDNEHHSRAAAPATTWSADPIAAGDVTLASEPVTGELLPAAALRGGVPSSLSSSVPSPRRRRIEPVAIEGLEKELQMVEEYGPECVDAMFGDEDGSDGGLTDLYVFSAVDDDNETDDEDTVDGGGDKSAFKGARFIHGPESKYTCDRANTAKVGDKLSPNEPAAQIASRVSSLNTRPRPIINNRLTPDCFS